MGSLFNEFNDELTPNKIEIAKELELKVKPETLAVLLRSLFRISVNEKLLYKLEKWILRTPSTSGQHVINTGEMTTESVILHKFSRGCRGRI